MSFDFRPDLTAETYNRPDTAHNGDAWATFLLGSLDANSTISSIPIQRPQVNYVGLFFHDDFKITQNLTLNLGMRYEFFTAMRDPQDRLSRYLDLTNPIPEFQGANAPVLPAEASALRTAAPVYNGAWLFTDEDHRGSWNAPKNLFLPRVGVAWRINDKTALRAGFARYIIPASLTQGLDILGSVQYPGFDATSDDVGPAARCSAAEDFGSVPRRTCASYREDVRPVHESRRSDHMVRPGLHTGVNDRYNVSVQRQLPGRILADITFFMNIGRSQPYNYDLNQIDPRIGYAKGNAINTAVNNPFFNLLPRGEDAGPTADTAAGRGERTSAAVSAIRIADRGSSRRTSGIGTSRCRCSSSVPS